MTGYRTQLRLRILESHQRSLSFGGASYNWNNLPKGYLDPDEQTNGVKDYGLLLG